MEEDYRLSSSRSRRQREENRQKMREERETEVPFRFFDLLDRLTELSLSQSTATIPTEMLRLLLSSPSSIPYRSLTLRNITEDHFPLILDACRRSVHTLYLAEVTVPVNDLLAEIISSCPKVHLVAHSSGRSGRVYHNLFIESSSKKWCVVM